MSLSGLNRHFLFIFRWEHTRWCELELLVIIGGRPLVAVGRGNPEKCGGLRIWRAEEENVRLHSPRWWRDQVQRSCKMSSPKTCDTGYCNLYTIPQVNQVLFTSIYFHPVWRDHIIKNWIRVSSNESHFYYQPFRFRQCTEQNLWKSFWIQKIWAPKSHHGKGLPFCLAWRVPGSYGSSPTSGRKRGKNFFEKKHPFLGHNLSHTYFFICQKIIIT